MKERINVSSRRPQPNDILILMKSVTNVASYLVVVVLLALPREPGSIMGPWLNLSQS